MPAVILTGIFAGCVHVVSGADHLIAMAPAAINNPQKAFKNSFSWGLGHSSGCLLYTSPSPRDLSTSRMPSSA